ncbi:hypothetical protein OKW22_000574 [Bacilli bacterium PM5-3]|nr:hypothetical protein [Bacilli bacterium PM5-3]MDH6603188.1 hypothetical protein [Bacilli bacterium PM5-9]
MIIFNLIFVALAIVLQLLNVYTITRTLKIKDSFMFLKLITNDYVFKTVKPYKMKILMYNRIYLLATIILAPLFIWLNNSKIILIIYFLLFLILPYLLNQYFISKYIEEVKNLNISHENQPFDKSYFALIYSSNDNTTVYKYGFYRYAINIASLKGKAIIAATISLIIILIACLLIFVKPIDSNKSQLQTELTSTQLNLNYGKQTLDISLNEVTSIEKIKELPTIINKIDGVQENGYIIGNFNLQGIGASTLYVKKDSDEFLKIKAGKKTYIYSEKDKNKMNTIYDTMVKELAKKKK